MPLVDVLANMAPGFARNTRSDLENLERRLADRKVLDELAACNFTGRRYRQFEDELARYGMSVLRGWMHSGYIFKLTAARGFALNPSDVELEELFRDPDAREELAIMTVALALPRFREHALIRGGWRFEGGASLTTYFVGACVYVFPNELRKRRAQRERWRRQDHGDPTLTAPREDHISNPELIAIGSMRVREDLDRLDPRTRAVLALTLDGYSQDEIVELLDETSIRAVEGLLHRWRKKEQNNRANAHGEVSRMDDRDEEFEALLERSSLGTPGARQLRGRTSPEQVAAARRIIELRNRIMHARLPGDPAVAGAELVQLLHELGYHQQAEQTRQEHLARRLDLERHLPGAASRDELDLVYQPMVELDSGRPIGVEALLRWRHPLLGTVPPAELLPIADQLRVSAEITEWVLRTACRQVAAWQREGYDVRLGVNISARQLLDPDFVPEVAATLSVHQTSPERLVVEISELEVAGNADLPAVASQLSKLRALGVRTALDDFGAGDMTLARLRRLPLDMVKLANSLTAGSNDGLTAVIVDVAQRLGLTVAADAPALTDLGTIQQDPQRISEALHTFLAASTVSEADNPTRHRPPGGQGPFHGQAGAVTPGTASQRAAQSGRTTVLLAEDEIVEAGPPSGPPELPGGEKGRRVVGADRQTLAKDLVKRYTEGESIRSLASSTGRSYGFIHRVLTESGVQLRQRGGARRRKNA